MLNQEARQTSQTCWSVWLPSGNAIVLLLLLSFVPCDVTADEQCMSKPTRNLNPSMPGWFESTEFSDLVKGFYQNHARFPSESIHKANARLSEIMLKIRNELQRIGVCQRVEYTGSSYEEIKTPFSDLEFDVMFILRDGGKLRVESQPKRGYATLVPTSSADEHLFRRRLEGDRLSSKLTREWFHGQLQQCINALGLSTQVILRYHGPASQLDVMSGPNKVWFSVDVVPAYEVNGELYVAKPLKDTADLESTSWRKSFSLEEKDLIKTIDAHDNGCRKQCIRILKVFREREPTFAALQSYFVKTTLIHAHREGLDWSQGKIGVRLVDLMRRLSVALHRSYLEHAFVPGWNILTGYSCPHLRNMALRIDRLLNSQKEMQRLLS